MEHTVERRPGSLKQRFASGWQTLEQRFEAILAAQQDMAARLGLLDRQMSTLVRDVRDLRGGVTRQLTAQDAELAAIKRQLTAQDAELAAMKGHLTAQGAQLVAAKSDLAAIKEKLAGHDGNFAGLHQKLDAVLSRLPKP